MTAETETTAAPLKQKRVRVTKEAIKGIDLNSYGSAEVLPIEDIIVDPDYQRDLRHDLVAKIAREYDIVKAGPILVSRRGGALYCVDGQHRLAGAQQAGEEEIFAHVVHGLDQKQEAELRLARNDRRSDSMYERFRTRLVMEDPKAEALVELAHQHGTQLNLEPNMHQGINALNAVEVLYDAGDGGGVWLSRSLKFLSEAFEGNLNGPNVSMAMLKASAWFIDRHASVGEANLKEMAERVGRIGQSDIDRKARAHKAALGGSLWLNYYRAYIEIWNFGRQDKNKLMWKTKGGLTTLGEAGPASIPPKYPRR